jgi:hypothetical protein
MQADILVISKWGGDKIFRAWRLQNRVSRGMDTKISAQGPESWRTRIYKQSFSEDPEGDARGRNIGDESAGGSYTCDYGDTTEIRSERCCGSDKRAKCEYAEEKVCVVGKSVLERKYRLVPGFFRLDDRPERTADHEICEVAGASGFRSSEA